MSQSTFDFGLKPVKLTGLGLSSKKKKRKSLTPAQRIYVWERPNIYGRTCTICHRRITKFSDLELDHTRPYSKGGTKLALAHKDCNRVKSSGSLGKIQKTLGIKTTKRKTAKKKPTKRKPSNPWGFSQFRI